MGRGLNWLCHTMPQDCWFQAAGSVTVTMARKSLIAPINCSVPIRFNKVDVFWTLDVG